MNRIEINAFDYANDIVRGLTKGAIVTAKADDQVNAMTISWGTLGREWEKNIFTIFIRETRFTHELLEKNPEFAVCIPREGFNRKIVGTFGTKSGRDIDKFKESEVDLAQGEIVSVPIIEAPSIVLECKVIWKRDQKIEDTDTAFHIYTTDANGEYVGPNHDTIYCGEIVKAYLLEN